MKEIKINFNLERFEYLISLFENGLLVDWKIVCGSNEIGPVVANFYHPSKN